MILEEEQNWALGQLCEIVYRPQFLKFYILMFLKLGAWPQKMLKMGLFITCLSLRLREMSSLGFIKAKN